MGEESRREYSRHDIDPSTDTSVERLQITEAARRLGISRDAVYKRVRRGSIPSETGEDSLLYVYIDAGLDASTDESTDTSYGTEQPISPHLERLLQHQERELEYLRGQLDAEREAHAETREARRRADHIIAALTERIPELEAPPQTPQEAQDAAESASGGESREEAGERQEEHTEPQDTGERRVPWWRRIFGG